MSSSSPSSSGKRSSGGGSENQGGEGGSGQTGSVERPARTKSVGQYQIFEKRLGRGSFSKVWLGERISDHTPVAVKVIDLRMLQSSKLRANLQKEIEISTELHHPNIMRMYGFHEGTSHVYLFLEYCPGGDLSTTIRKLHSLSEEQCCFWGFQLVFGISMLHSKNVMHRDLKPQNLLLSEDSLQATLKIADFGFAREIEEASMAETMCGTPLYMAPEVLGNQPYSTKADLWSVGVILFEMRTGYFPFSARDRSSLLRDILRGPVKRPREVDISDQLWSIIQGLLQVDVRRRMDHIELLSHPFWDKHRASPLPPVEGEMCLESLLSSFSECTIGSRSSSSIRGPEMPLAGASSNGALSSPAALLPQSHQGQNGVANGHHSPMNGHRSSPEGEPAPPKGDSPSHSKGELGHHRQPSPKLELPSAATHSMLLSDERVSSPPKNGKPTIPPLEIASPEGSDVGGIPEKLAHELNVATPSGHQTQASIDEDTSMDTLSIILRELREGLQSLQASSSEGSEFDSAESSLLQGVYENISHIEELAKQTWVISDTALRKAQKLDVGSAFPLLLQALHEYDYLSVAFSELQSFIGPKDQSAGTISRSSESVGSSTEDIIGNPFSRLHAWMQWIILDRKTCLEKAKLIASNLSSTQVFPDPHFVIFTEAMSMVKNATLMEYHGNGRGASRLYTKALLLLDYLARRGSHLNSQDRASIKETQQKVKARMAAVEDSATTQAV